MMPSFAGSYDTQITNCLREFEYTGIIPTSIYNQGVSVVIFGMSMGPVQNNGLYVLVADVVASEWKSLSVWWDIDLTNRLTWATSGLNQTVYFLNTDNNTSTVISSNSSLVNIPTTHEDILFSTRNIYVASNSDDFTIGSKTYSADEIYYSVYENANFDGIPNETGMTSSDEKKFTGFFGGLQQFIYDLFVPDTAEISDAVNSLRDKFSFAYNIFNVGSILTDYFNDLKATPPNLTIHLNAAESPNGVNWGTSANTIDLSWYPRYKPYVDAIIVAFVYISYYYRTFKNLPAILGGDNVTQPDDGTRVKKSFANR